MPKETVLVVDDQPEILRSLERLLKDDYEVLTAPGGAEALDLLKRRDVAVILSDQRMPKMTGVEFLEAAIGLRPDAARILITAYADLDASIDAVNKGKIYHYIAKPWEPDDLTAAVRRAAERFRLIGENRRLAADLVEANARLERENVLLKNTLRKEYDFRSLVGGGPAMTGVFDLVSRVIDTPVTVLLLGETGTGKELLAKAIHFNGPRAARPFVAQNCGALPDALLESELFGHVRGAFTGAVRDRKGLFETADGGTVFLDEIADTSAAMQQRLLRVLEEGEIRPVGAVKPKTVDVRIIAATNKNLESELKAGRFREDLYYRLNVFPVRLPPLRERREDIPDLADHFVRKCSERLRKPVRSMDPAALALLVRAEFPGNIRELENEIERAVALVGSDGIITPDLLSPRFRLAPAPPGEADTGSGTMKHKVESLEKRWIEEALQKSGNNITKAAEMLGLSRLGLYKKLDRYGIKTSGKTDAG
jgi:two-component system, NtrC family, response regulator HupR/HoxA